MIIKKMKIAHNCFNSIVLIASMLLFQSCEREDPTIFSGDVVDTVTGNIIPGVPLLVSVYERPPTWLTLLGIIKRDTIETDGQGHFNIVIPYDEQLSRFTINVLKKIVDDTYEFVNVETDCSPYDCSSFKPGHVYKFELKIPLDSL